jgi:2-methylcitrate dehydratase PrpD
VATVEKKAFQPCMSFRSLKQPFLNTVNHVSFPPVNDKLGNHTVRLSQFVAGLSYEALPDTVIDGTKRLFIDWFGSALAGKDHVTVSAFRGFAQLMGPQALAPASHSTVLCSQEKTSAYFAAMINAAASHVVEQDDLHNSSVLHPATVVFPAVVAIAEERNLDGKKVIEAVVAGYEVGIRVGEFLGLSHYEHFHTTGTVGTVAAAAAVAKALDLTVDQVGHALGTSGTTAAGLWEFLRDGADSKQVHTAHAAATGLMAAILAEKNVTAGRDIFDGAHGMGAAMSSDANAHHLSANLGERWALLETSYKWHASCRHTHPAADALQAIMQRENLAADAINKITAYVHQAAIDVLGPVRYPTTVHQSKFCMASVLGLIAVFGEASLKTFDDYALQDTAVLAFHDRVEMVFDETIDAAYPKKWTSRVVVETKSGEIYESYVETPKGDPENPLSFSELTNKALTLAAYPSEPLELTQVQAWLDGIAKLEVNSKFRSFFRVK